MTSCVDGTALACARQVVCVCVCVCVSVCRMCGRGARHVCMCVCCVLAELRRLVERLSDVHSRISHLQTAPDVLQAAERACHDAGLDWLPPVVDEMRR